MEFLFHHHHLELPRDPPLRESVRILFSSHRRSWPSLHPPTSSVQQYHWPALQACRREGGHLPANPQNYPRKEHCALYFFDVRPTSYIGAPHSQSSAAHLRLQRPIKHRLVTPPPTANQPSSRHDSGSTIPFASSPITNGSNLYQVNLTFPLETLLWEQKQLEGGKDTFSLLQIWCQ